MIRYLPKDIYNTLLKIDTTKPKLKGGGRWKLDIAVELLWQIQRQSHVSDWGSQRFTFVTLSSTVNRKIVKQYKCYFNLFISNGILTVNNSYLTGVYSKSYIFPQKYYTNDVYYHKITNKSLLNKIDTHYSAPSSSTLPNDAIKQRNFIRNNVTIDLVAAKEWITKQGFTPQREASYIYVCEQIHNKNIFFIIDKYGRRHHNLTNIASYIRKNFIYINGDSTIEIDIPNSQPRFLLNWLSDKAIPLKELELYTSLVRSSGIYEHIMIKWEELYGECITRDEAKLIVFKCFYDKERPKPKQKGRTNWHYQHLFRINFPAIYKSMKDYKNKYGYKSMARDLQKIESKFVFDRVKDINIPYFTVHDSICIQKKYNNKYSNIMEEIS